MSDAAEEKQESKGVPAWVMTFADLMTLLMCFFVLLLSFSEMDVAKFKQLSGSMKEAFGVQSEIEVKTIPTAETKVPINAPANPRYIPSSVCGREPSSKFPAAIALRSARARQPAMPPRTAPVKNENPLRRQRNVPKKSSFNREQSRKRKCDVPNEPSVRKPLSNTTETRSRRNPN